ncbi:hypothetical protein KVR01_007121 [Diaporthe batatas]|uniref:uncharacterized protein n=1 Tax=Diaporthe batatas TaxID=748121 RepID=UPI001D0448F7|nr:uncharacterized protein KVR01_007121 [Diaporthe batatas]KAG8162643.1 hypothetical protein KVR01_007121 [Diaporthe batatas]
MADPSEDLLSAHAFLVFIWVSVGILTVAFTIRAYVRYVCFGRLLLEDWLVAASLALYIPCAVLTQLYLHRMYNMAHAMTGKYVPGPTFVTDMITPLRLAGVNSILITLGLWLIKASFLILFYRLGYRIPRYLYAWWACTIIISACGIVSIALNQYSCMFEDIDTIFATCTQASTLNQVFIKEITASVMDIVSDLLLIVFPIWILAGTTLSLRQKIVFSAVFCLVGLTIAVTIVRGYFSKVIHETPTYGLQQTNINWPFWFAVEYTTSFLVACAISFRSLFVQQRNKRSAAAERDHHRQSPPTSAQKGHSKNALRRLHMKFLSTAHLLEGTAYDHETWHLPEPVSGTMTVDFSKDEGWRPGGEDGESMKALRPPVHRYTTEVSVV